MRDRIDRAIAEGEHESIGRLLAGAHTPEHRYAARRIAEAGASLEAALAVAESLAGQKESAARQVACQLVPEVYSSSPDRAASLLRTLADDGEWTVRDAAGEVCGRLLRDDFSRMLDELYEWRKDRSANVRRAVAVAAGRAASAEHPEWAEPLLKLIEPLLSDRDKNLRRTLAASTIGTSLLGSYPIMAFEYIIKWSTSSDPQVLWNVATALSTPTAAGLVKKALIILRKLSLDERRYVWRAAAAAMWRLGRKRPEIVRPELARWLEDERRIEVAREALKHI